MSPSAGAARRSGDPRKRAAAAAPADEGGGRRRLLVAIAVVLAGLLGIGLFALRSGSDSPDTAGRGHAETACDLTSKAEEAAGVDTGARYAAAVLLLDQAIIESARAAKADDAFAELDAAVQAVHSAGHAGDEEQWRVTLDAALDACRSSVD